MKLAHTSRRAIVAGLATAPLAGLAAAPLAGLPDSPAAGADPVLDALAMLETVRVRLRVAQDASNDAERAYDEASVAYERGGDRREFHSLMEGRAKLAARAEKEARYYAALDDEWKAIARVIRAKPKSPTAALAFLNFVAGWRVLSDIGEDECAALQAAMTRAIAILAAQNGAPIPLIPTAAA